jgi:nicotinamidase-related amidase
MIYDFITFYREHSALLIIDIQYDFTLIGATGEVPGTLQAVQYIQHLVHVYRATLEFLHRQF